MASHGAAPPAAGGSGLKITFKRTLPNPSPIPSTSAALPPAPLDHSSRSAASSTAPSARSGSRETPQSVKIRIPSATVDSAAQIELTRKYEALKTKYRTLEEVRRVSEIRGSPTDSVSLSSLARSRLYHFFARRSSSRTSATRNRLSSIE